MCGYFCVGPIDFMLKGKSSLEYTNFFCDNEWQNNFEIFSIESK